MDVALFIPRVGYKFNLHIHVSNVFSSFMEAILHRFLSVSILGLVFILLCNCMVILNLFVYLNLSF